jgi:murein DD-endopeptidase / murein LD-carboxypeptidase
MNKLISILSAAIIFLSCTLAKNNDPIDILLKRITNSKLKERILVFKKGGYQLTAKYKTHDVEAIIKSAESFLGTRHQMGGLTHDGIDCSGLVMVAHQQNQVMLPHDGNEQARYGKIILSVNDLQRGDLVFFHSTYNTDKLITHSGIYLGNNEFIHTSAKLGVSTVSINSKYWADHFLFGTRL